MKPETQHKVYQILATVLKSSEDSVANLFNNPNTVRWDSLAQVSIIMAIESEFGMKLKASDYSRVASPDGIASLLEEKGF